MRNTKPQPARRKVSPVVAVAVIVLVVALVMILGFSSIKPKPSPPLEFGMKDILPRRVQNQENWAKELAAAKREGREPNRDLEPVIGPGIAETRGSLKAKAAAGKAANTAPTPPMKGTH